MGATDGRLSTRVVRSGIWVGLSNAGQSLLQIVRSIILARLLSPEVFGLMGICLIVIRGLDLFTETGIGPALIHRQERVDEAKNTAFTLQIIRGVLLAGLALLLGPLAAHIYDEPQLTSLIYVLAIVFAINGLANLNTVLLQKQLDFRRLTFLELLVAVSSTIAVAALAFWLRSVWALVLGHVMMSIMRVVLSYVLIREHPVPRFDKQLAREIFQYGRYITGLTIVLFVTTEVDNMVIGKVLGFEWLGYYTMAFTLANIPATHISKIASNVLFPAYSSIQRDSAKMRLAYLTVLRVVGGIAIPAAAGLAALAPDVVTVVYGPKWAPAVPALRILALFGAARAVGMLGGYLYNALGKPKISFYLTAGKLLVILACIYPMTARFGVTGAALAVAIPQVLGDALGLVIVQRQIALRLSQILRILGRIVLASSIMVAVVLIIRAWLPPFHAGSLILLIVVGAVTYGVVSARELASLYAEHMRGRRRAAAPAVPASPPPAAE